MAHTRKPKSLAGACCRIQSMVSVDERGQMVLPKNVRELAGIKAGDKLALVTWELEGQVRGIALLQADRIADVLQGMLAPIIGSPEGGS
jgi:antitoxin PrlF